MMASMLAGFMANAQSKVFFTTDISPESLVKIYKALGVEVKGRVAVKISTGEAGNNHYLKPTLIRNLVDEVNGTIVECCTAYGGSRQDVTKHWQTIHEHGFDSIFAVDIMDEFGQMRIPVKDRSHIKYDIVGDHLANYDWMINLAHFKGHRQTVIKLLRGLVVIEYRRKIPVTDGHSHFLVAYFIFWQKHKYHHTYQQYSYNCQNDLFLFVHIILPISYASFSLPLLSISPIFVTPPQNSEPASLAFSKHSIQPSIPLTARFGTFSSSSAAVVRT